MDSSIIIRCETPTTAAFVKLRNDTGWGSISSRQAEIALNNSLVCVTAYRENSLIGAARAIGDGALNIYIQDVIVMQPYRGSGLGRQLVQGLLNELSALASPACTIRLMAAKGQENFYKYFRFIERPNNRFGAGMVAALGELK